MQIKQKAFAAKKGVCAFNKALGNWLNALKGIDVHTTLMQEEELKDELQSSHLQKLLIYNRHLPVAGSRVVLTKRGRQGLLGRGGGLKAELAL